MKKALRKQKSNIQMINKENRNTKVFGIIIKKPLSKDNQYPLTKHINNLDVVKKKIGLKNFPKDLNDILIHLNFSLFAFYKTQLSFQTRYHFSNQQIINQCKFSASQQLLISVAYNQLAYIKIMLTQGIQNWDHLKDVVLANYKRTNIVNECIYAQNQDDLLEKIKDKIIAKTSIQMIESTKLIQSTSHQSTCQSITFHKTMGQFKESILKGKFIEQLEQTILQNALKEVQTKCSNQTYEYFKKNALNPQNQEFLLLKRGLQKSKKQIQTLSCLNTILNKEKANILWELNLLKPKFENVERQKAKMKKNLQQLNSKQRILLSLETSLALKQKVINERKKKYEREQKSAQQMKDQLQSTIQQFWQIYEEISKLCSKRGCQHKQQCWKKQIMNKFKVKFMEFRQHLKKQQEQLQTQYIVISNISNQFKIFIQKSQKLINNSQKKNITNASQ